MSTLRSIRRRQLPTLDLGDAHWPSGMSPLLRRVHAARGSVNGDAALPRLSGLLPPDGLLGIDAACALLRTAMDEDRHIVIVGDFDADGATATALGVRGLGMLGARRVSHAVPNRMVHGYGLSPALVDELAALQPDLLVTVDHGIACHAGIDAARARGWQVLVTDHHLPGESLPAADAIVNPNQPGDGFASKALAGVGVMFYLLLALRRSLRDDGMFGAGNGPDLSSLLDLVAVGTVADLVPLDANNRALVAAGLRRLRAGQGCAGLQALIEVAGRRAEVLTAADIGFAVAPRINAAGRLQDMALGIECLLSDDAGHAAQIAGTLDAINRERRNLQQAMVEDAEAALAHVDADLADGSDNTENTAIAHCLFHPDWHPGVVGLVASKIKERLHRPVIAFAPAEPGADVLRGSARSIPGFHVRDALAAVDAMQPGLIQRFGGHAMAAGLSLHVDALEAFRTAFAQVAQALLTPEQLQDVLLSDGALDADEFTRGNAEQLRDGGVWGQGYPEPLFDGQFEVDDWRIVGQTHLKLDLRLGHRRLSAIHFGGWDGNEPSVRQHIAYRLAPDDWRGGDAVQLIVVHRQAL